MKYIGHLSKKNLIGILVQGGRVGENFASEEEGGGVSTKNFAKVSMPFLLLRPYFLTFRLLFLLKFAIYLSLYGVLCERG